MSQPPGRPSDEIDLRHIAQAITKGWRWIVGFSLGLGILGLIVSILVPGEFESTATVALIDPELTYQFDARIRTDIQMPPTEGLSELAMSRDVMRQVLDVTSTSEDSIPYEDHTVDDLRRTTTASLNGNLLRLKVVHRDPHQAAHLSNAWADVMLDRIGLVYAASVSEEETFERQADEARARWIEAQEALNLFQRSNRAELARQKLTTLQDALTGVERSRQQFRLLLYDIEAARIELESQPEDRLVRPREELVVLLLTLRSLRSESSSDADPFEDLGIQLAFGERLEGGTVDEQQEYLRRLASRVQEEMEGLEEESSVLEARILEEQARIESDEQHLQRLRKEAMLAEETYEVLARRSREAQLATHEGNDIARVAAKAVAASEPARPKPLRNSILATIGGFWIGLAWLFGRSLFES